VLVRILTASSIESRANENRDRKEWRSLEWSFSTLNRLGAAASSRNNAEGKGKRKEEPLDKVSDAGRRGDTAGSSRDKAKGKRKEEREEITREDDANTPRKVLASQ
jgi:hypothetical protein